MRSRAARAAPWFALAGTVLALDRATKAGALAALAPGEVRPVTPFLNLVLVRNDGAAFGLLAGFGGWQRPLLAAIAAGIAVAIAVLLWRGWGGFPARLALALVLGGAVGNLWDRLAWGHVVDFVDVHAFGWHWPAFNLADAAISVGAALLVADGLVRRAPGA